jgi:hypothetical protein
MCTINLHSPCAVAIFENKKRINGPQSPATADRAVLADQLWDPDAHGDFGCEASGSRALMREHTARAGFQHRNHVFRS